MDYASHELIQSTVRVGLPLFHDVWCLSLDISMAGCHQWLGVWNHLVTTSLACFSIDPGCYL